VLVEGRLGSARLDELAVVRTDHGVSVECARAGVHVDLVEHLFAALGGLSLREAVTVGVAGGEVPLLGGGATELANALDELQVPARPPALVVGRSDTFVEGLSRYEFRTSATTELSVAVDFPGVGTQTARWDGTPDAFKREIAPARTFGFLRDAVALRRAGRAITSPPPRWVASRSTMRSSAPETKTSSCPAALLLSTKLRAAGNREGRKTLSNTSSARTTSRSSLIPA
jgi:UDP-3-O-[3-hydroxymyristoyl] N-acetylglucosamine deacetylase